MKVIKILALLACSLCLVAPVEAANNKQDAKKKKEQKEKERKEKAARREALNDFIKPLDKNNDGSLSKEEFLAGESDKEAGAKKFDQYNKNEDRFLSKSEIADMLGK